MATEKFSFSKLTVWVDDYANDQVVFGNVLMLKNDLCTFSLHGCKLQYLCFVKQTFSCFKFLFLFGDSHVTQV